jgi:hypothetical protein
MYVQCKECEWHCRGYLEALQFVYYCNLHSQMCLIRATDIYSDDKFFSPHLIRKILALAYLQTSTLPGPDCGLHLPHCRSGDRPILLYSPSGSLAVCSLMFVTEAARLKYYCKCKIVIA